MKHCTAIALAGGQGRRMGTNIQKQYLDISGKPLLYYSLHVFEESEIIDDIVLVVGEGQEEYVRKEIVDRYGFTKVVGIVEGGKERYDSVWAGLQAVQVLQNSHFGTEEPEENYVFIHDSARPFVTEAILERAYGKVREFKACVVGMPSKDTVKLVDEHVFAKETPDRNYVWIIQTPQVFDTSLIFEAYSRLMREKCIQVTDDAMVVEQMMRLPVKMVEGSYENIKITTPEDLDIAEVFVKRGREKS
ncbi:2-C-methyl-D-erythritol 4-phosphate cytidylyltransferase [Sporofaciens sp. SGI.106]|uniref:2-C-methyl-D-erythritol 4-phosphate cytidylyltransferase n=1 Tax=Sporofaciens sp. SGI.106 TaxID=3420568 RepID=UPI002A9572F5|nr:2-C-methyl-D-erythritol 4-phosphate cytidylyltransferase [Lachnoclostridium sp.]